MPHYKDGLEAKIGDRVRGKGYNVKGPDGELREIEGIVVGITPGVASCNIKVAHLGAGEGNMNGTRIFNHGAIFVGDSAVIVNLEYGQADAFTFLEGVGVTVVHVDGVPVRFRGKATGADLKMRAGRDIQHCLVRESEGDLPDVPVSDTEVADLKPHDRFITHPAGTF